MISTTHSRAAGEPTRLGELLARLDQIRRELDRDDLDLEDQLTLYREGCGHVLSARRILDGSRTEVELLMQEAAAIPVTEPGLA